jgi:hypothetical protein
MEPEPGGRIKCRAGSINAERVVAIDKGAVNDQSLAGLRNKLDEKMDQWKGLRVLVGPRHDGRLAD